ncbi:MAG TPA: archease [Candidatus Nanoarchaeia archaeon]|nr:archease [Candidatus Nanoarchaeia archaeon]
MQPFYKFLEHTADVLFEAEAGTLEDLFIQCALAAADSQVDINRIKPKVKQHIAIKHKDIERLLFDFLDDLIFYKDSKQLIFTKFDLKIRQLKDGIYSLDCQAHGEKLSHTKHDPKVDVKAVTMHLFEVKKTPRGWKAKVLLDI